MTVAHEGELRQLPYVPPPGSTDVLLVRHGESGSMVRGAALALTDGQTDPPLAPGGTAEAESVGARLARQHIDAIYTSPLRRCVETSEPLAGALGLTPQVEQDLREVFMGEWEGGLYRKKFAERDPIALRMLAEQRWDVIPRAEPAPEFTERIRSVIATVAARHVRGKIAVFTHAGVIGEALAQASGAEPFTFIGPNNASISQLVVTPDKWVIRRFNDASHLEPG
jgi:2,3-bisphosphoglycerate-dependent phosphoglycerate mutase